MEAICFDTTAASTGRQYCTDLLHLAYPHHVKELVLASVFEATMGGSSEPDALLFKRFQTQR